MLAMERDKVNYPRSCIRRYCLCVLQKDMVLWVALNKDSSIHCHNNTRDLQGI